jgi:hypothetical protein
MGSYKASTFRSVKPFNGDKPTLIDESRMWTLAQMWQKKAVCWQHLKMMVGHNQ